MAHRDPGGAAKLLLAWLCESGRQGNFHPPSRYAPGLVFEPAAKWLEADDERSSTENRE
jgi:hypothetical protein